MELTEAVQTVRRWVSSCETVEQVELLPPFIKDYLIKRWEMIDGFPQEQISIAKTDLFNAIADRKKVLKELLKPYSTTEI